jgi:hypothetical protein
MGGTRPCVLGKGLKLLIIGSQNSIKWYRVHGNWTDWWSGGRGTECVRIGLIGGLEVWVKSA